MPSFTCAVVDCKNTSRGLLKWNSETCDVHKCTRKEELCTCKPPYRFIPFPTNKFSQLREEWICKMRRVDPSTKKPWIPKHFSRVCSIHFVDLTPSASRVPTLHLGYDVPPPTSRRTIKRTVPDPVPAGPAPKAVRADSAESSVALKMIDFLAENGHDYIISYDVPPPTSRRTIKRTVPNIVPARPTPKAVRADSAEPSVALKVIDFLAESGHDYIMPCKCAVSCHCKEAATIIRSLEDEVEMLKKLVGKHGKEKHA